MCLTSYQLTPTVAEKDITVYKVLTAGNLAPYKGMEYHHGLNYPEQDPPEEPVVMSGEQLKWVDIDRGYLHAFRTIYHARVLANHMDFRLPADSEKHQVVKMRIPAGSKYYEGVFDEIASTALAWDED